MKEVLKKRLARATVAVGVAVGASACGTLGIFGSPSPDALKNCQRGWADSTNEVASQANAHSALQRGISTLMADVIGKDKTAGGEISEDAVGAALTPAARLAFLYSHDSLVPTVGTYVMSKQLMNEPREEFCLDTGGKVHETPDYLSLVAALQEANIAVDPTQAATS